MATLADMTLGFGEIVYRVEKAPRPETSETSRFANVTVNIHNVEKPGKPAHYEASFVLDCKFEDGSVQFSNAFRWTAVVVGLEADAPYLTIEAEAARQIAPMLRDVAQRIEEEVAKYDQQHSQQPPAA